MTAPRRIGASSERAIGAGRLADDCAGTTTAAASCGLRRFQTSAAPPRSATSCSPSCSVFAKRCARVFRGDH